MGPHLEQGPAEKWVGNVEAQELPADIRHIATARLGHVARDVYGDRLPSRIRPLFIGLADLEEYDRVKMAEFRAAGATPKTGGTTGGGHGSL